MHHKIKITLLTLIFSNLLSGCLQQGSTYSDHTEKKPEAIVWDNELKKTLYLQPINYAAQDPLGKQQQQLQQQRIERLMGKMMPIPSGSFQMGGTNKNEKPIHRVSIRRFKLGQYEVTQQQWQAVMGSNPSYFKNCNNCPVEQVNWNDIQAFIKKLNQQTGQRFRLPTEAEWEYACRSGGKNEKYCGGNHAPSLGWYSENSGNKTHSVGQKGSNGLGLYDMSGNVWEWTQDCWNASYNGAPSNGRAWNSSDCSRRVLRGGSWFLMPNWLRSASRNWYLTTFRYYDIGFRLAQD